MKTLGKLQINPDRIMKNDELMTLRGGYGALKCIRSWIWGGDCDLSGNDIDCNDEAGMRLECGFFCPGWNSYICVGPLM